jgi:hypothetical protein
MPEWVQAILVGASTLIGAGTFWYTDIHRPAVSPATLTIAPSLETIGRQGNDLLVRASLKIDNRSHYRVYVPAFWYTVRGQCFHPRALPADSYEAAVGTWNEGGIHSRFNREETGELLVVGRPSPRKDTYFEPGSERRYEELFLVPRERYAALRMQVNYMVAKDISEVDTTRWRMEKNRDVREEVFIARRTMGFDSLKQGFGRMTVSEPYNRLVHTSWRERAGAAWGWSHASLALSPTSGGAEPSAACAPG